MVSIMSSLCYVTAFIVMNHFILIILRKANNTSIVHLCPTFAVHLYLLFQHGLKLKVVLDQMDCLNCASKSLGGKNPRMLWVKEGDRNANIFHKMAVSGRG